MNDEKTIVPFEEDELSVCDMRTALITAPTAYCSMIPKTDEQRAHLFNAMTDPTYKLNEAVNKELFITDIFCEPITMTEERDGVEREVTVPRIVLIDKEGNSYQCVSTGIFNALQKLITIFGEPTWPDGVRVIVKSINKGSGKNTRQILTLSM